MNDVEQPSPALDDEQDKRTGGRPSPANRKEGNPNRRVPMTGAHRDILSVDNLNPAYVYRWAKDNSENGASIYRYKQAGYDFAPREEDGHILGIGMNSVYKPGNKRASIVRLPASKNDSEAGFLYLMRIKREWYEEDQKSEQDEIRKNELSVAGNFDGEDPNGYYGEVKIGGITTSG